MKPEKHHGKSVKNAKPENEKRHHDNVEMNSSSMETTKFFSKSHGRRHYSFGDGHEPGTLPGTGV